MTPSGPVDGPEPTLEGGTRQTLNVADTVRSMWSVSAQVESDEPIIAERAMYWNSGEGVYRQAAHDFPDVRQVPSLISNVKLNS
jgi:hypothetical protein